MTTSPSFSLALVSMPWPAFNRPSVQLGSLKSYLAQDEIDTPSLSVHCFHPYLEVAQLLGEEVYQWLASEVWVCEALYSAILFPDNSQSAIALIEQGLISAGKKNLFDIPATIALLDDHLERWLHSIIWEKFSLVGFSICLNQLLATLAAIKRLRKLYPALPIAVGGSSCTPVAAPALADLFAINYVVCGEGEEALHHLCSHMDNKRALPASIYVREQGWGTGKQRLQLQSLSSLPCPDYDDYFAQLKTSFPGGFRPVLPIEFSRGCWWGKCSFCNLNIQWQGYRLKKAEQMYIELTELRKRYSCLDYTFTDNALPVRDSLEFFDRCANEPGDYRFFAEIRASQRGSELARLQQGGLDAIQVGIEAFSTSLLQRFNKGMRVIDNLAIMRDALSCGVVLDGNLIIAFPGSSDEEIAETMTNLDFAFPFHPLTTATFFLGAGSPVDCQPAEFGILARLAHPANKKLFPGQILASFPQLIKGYRGDRQQQKQKWQQVTKKVMAWQEYHQQRGRDIYRHPLLSFRDGNDFIDIRQECPDGRVLRHRLEGTSRRIYLSCLDIINIEHLLKRFPRIRLAVMENFLASMVSKRLMFSENNHYLALAVHNSNTNCARGVL